MAGSVVITEDDDGWGSAPTVAPPTPGRKGKLVLTEDDGGWEAAPSINQAPGPWRAGFVDDKPDVPRLPPQDQLPENRPEPVGGVEAAIRGAGRGAFGGFAPKVAGGAYAYGVSPHISLTGITEASNRNRAAGDPTGTRAAKEVETAYAARDDQAREEKPWQFFGGMLAGPGARTLRGNMALGGAYAASESKADTAGGLARDTAIGVGTAGTIGVAAKGVAAAGRKVFGGAAARNTERATNDLLGGVPARTVQDPNIATLGGKENIPKVLKQEGMEKALRGPAKKLDEQLVAKMDEVGGAAGEVYKKVVKADPGVQPEYVRDTLLKLAARKVDEGDVEAARAVESYANELTAAFADRGAINAEQLHGVVRTLGRKGYRTNPQNPSDTSMLRREMRREVLGVLQQHVDDVAKEHPEVGSLAELKKLNERYRRLSAIEDIADAKADREARVSPTLGQRMQQGVRYATGAAGAMGAAQQLMEGNVGVAAVGALAGGAALAAPVVVRAADRLAERVNDARLVNFLRTSPTIDEFLTRAIRVGIPRELALQALQVTGPPQQGAPAQQLPATGAPLLSGN